jgi:N4-gp56 family major capsid protein
MSGQTYSAVEGRIENFRGRVLERVNAESCTIKYGDQHDHPMNESMNGEFIRILPYGNVDNQLIAPGGDVAFVDAHRIADGVTPQADSVGRVTVPYTMEELGCLYTYTNRLYELHEDGHLFVQEMEPLVSDRMTLAVDMQNWGEMKGAANDFYGGDATALDPTTVNGPMTRLLAQTIEKTLRRNHGLPITRMEKSSTDYGSSPVPASFVALCHTDLRMSMELDVGFTKVEEYGHVSLLDDRREFGKIGSVRFLEDPTLTYLPNYGVAVGDWTGDGEPASDAGVNINVYPIVFMGQGRGGGNPFGQVRIKSKKAFEPASVPLKQRDSGDPLGQRGYIGGLMYHTQLIQNDAWIAVAFVGARVS